MARITKYLRTEDRGEYALIHVMIDGQDEAIVLVGGFVEVWHSDKYDRTVAWVKRPNRYLKPPEHVDKPETKSDSTEVK